MGQNPRAKLAFMKVGSAVGFPDKNGHSRIRVRVTAPGQGCVKTRVRATRTRCRIFFWILITSNGKILSGWKARVTIGAPFEGVRPVV